MIKNLQLKFIIITMLAVIIISGSIFGLIIVENYRASNQQTDVILRLIAENEGQMPEYKESSNEDSSYITKETKFSTRYFTVELDENDEIVSTNMKNIATVSNDDIENIVKSIDGKEGYYKNFKYRVIHKDSNKFIIFLDCNMQLRALKHTTIRSINIIIIGWIIVLIIISLSSKKILRPIIQNIEKQKQFITNASHELKTPLAVITADIDVLEMSVGEENEWLKSIKGQTNRLNTIIKSLLNLAKAEEGRNNLEISEFSITDIINDEIKEFKPLLKNKNIEFDDTNNVNIKADINMIKQVITILIDNAIKYTNDMGTIKIEAEKQGRKTKIEVCNTCESTKEINISRVFDRFYRDDKSRNKKKEGYGIGLSIAKSIVDVHKGKISAYINDKDMICFKIII